jgi:hypothetical protein
MGSRLKEKTIQGRWSLISDPGWVEYLKLLWDEAAKS